MSGRLRIKPLTGVGEIQSLDSGLCNEFSQYLLNFKPSRWG